MSDETGVGMSIEDVVRAVPGVTSVYPQLPELLGLPVVVADLAREAVAHVVEPTVRIRIGIDDADASRAVCERVHAAVFEYLSQATPGVVPRIAVSVVAIG